MGNDFKNGQTGPEFREGGITDFVVELNEGVLLSASKEYVTRTMIHEFLHAYLQYTGSYGTLKNHNQMANEYAKSIENSLTGLFPNLSNADAKALSWGGLQDTNAWDSIQANHPQEAIDMSVADSRFRVGERGTNCIN